MVGAPQQLREGVVGPVLVDLVDEEEHLVIGKVPLGMQSLELEGDALHVEGI